MFEVDSLLSSGADLDSRDFENLGFSAMHYAARAGRCAVLALLAARGADINAEDDCFSTPLHIAASGCHDAAVAVLLEIGAKTNKTNDCGYTPLHCAASAGASGVAERLLAAGAAPDARDLRGRTAARIAEELADEGMDRRNVLRALTGSAGSAAGPSAQVVRHPPDTEACGGTSRRMCRACLRRSHARG